MAKTFSVVAQLGDTSVEKAMLLDDILAAVNEAVRMAQHAVVGAELFAALHEDQKPDYRRVRIFVYESTDKDHTEPVAVVLMSQAWEPQVYLRVYAAIVESTPDEEGKDTCH